jgi:hypothetical protein
MQMDRGSDDIHAAKNVLELRNILMFLSGKCMGKLKAIT